MGEFYTAKKGDYLAKIAHAHGIRDWRGLYEHPANESLREARPNPNMLAEGDQVYIPQFEKDEHPADTGERHTFDVPLEHNRLKVILRRSDGEPFANIEGVLEIGDEKFDVSTDGDGLLEHEFLPPDAEKATLTFEGQILSLMIGHLEPAAEVRGLQGRLRNLGFYIGACTGVMDDPTSAAVASFKQEHGLGDDDQVTPEVTDKLVEEYGQ